jgi:hypothetical protein
MEFKKEKRESSEEQLRTTAEHSRVNPSKKKSNVNARYPECYFDCFRSRFHGQ